MGGIIAYCLMPNKPHLPITQAFILDNKFIIPNRLFFVWFRGVAAFVTFYKNFN